MKKNLFKKSMSVFLSVLMLMSCWVFAPATHEHLTAEAVDAGDAVTAYNKELLNQINTTVDTNMTKAFGKFLIAGNGDNGSDYNTTRAQQSYVNVLYSPYLYNTSTPAATFGTVTNADRVAVWYPETVLMYDGATSRMAVLLEVDSSSAGALRVVSAWMSANQNGLEFDGSYQAGSNTGNENHWKGYTDNGDSAHAYIMYSDSDKYYASANGTEHSSYKFNVAKGKWGFLGGHLKFTGTLSDTEWVRTIKPTWNFWGGKDGSTQKYTGTTNNPIYVMNIQGYKRLVQDIISKKGTLNGKEGQYTRESLQRFVNACNKITNDLAPKNYVSTTTNNVTSWASQMNTAYTELNNAYNGLVKRNVNVGYENLFSFSDWAQSNSPSYNASNGEVVLENNDTVKIYKSIAGGELTTSSSYPNSHDAKRYTIPVTGGKDYTVRFNITSSVSGTPASEVFLFWYDANNNPVNNTAGSATFNNKGFSDDGIKSVTFTAPANATKAEIRFDNDSATSASTIRFNDIAVYPAERNTAVEVDSWSTRPVMKTVQYGSTLSGKLDVPVRDGYVFNGWYTDTKNVNGTMDDGEAVTDAQGNVTNKITVTDSINLYADWKPLPMDIGYDNMFSLAEWAKTDSVKVSGNGSASYDVMAGTITVNCASGGETYTNYGSGSTQYKVAVEPETDYVFEADLSFTAGNKGQMFVFFYDANGNALAGSTWYERGTGAPETASHIGIYPETAGTSKITFKTPANCTQVGFRVGSTGDGFTTVYSNIGVYKKDAYDAYAKDYATIRVPFNFGDTTSLALVPTREGYQFDGWYTANDTKLTSVTGLKASDTVYAKWTKLFTVIFKNWDGTVLKTQYVAPNAAATAPQEPNRAGDKDYEYDFDKWDTDFSNVKSDLVVTATFKSKDHTDIEKTYQSGATCTKAATYTQLCRECGFVWTEVFEDPAMSALGHTYDRANPSGTVVTDKGTETSHTVKCNDCDATTTKAHDYKLDANHPASEATCVIVGETYYKCACLREKTEIGTTNPNKHVNTEIINKKDAKCGEEGYTGDKYCNDCKKTVETGTVIEALEHKYTNYVYNEDATCTADGTKTATCDNGCGTKDTIKAEGTMIPHSFTKYESNGDATCDADGTKTAKCDYNCGKTDTVTDTGSKRVHKFDGAVKNNEDGTHSFECSYDNCAVYGGTVDCGYGAWTNDNAATHSHTCKVCSYTPAAEAHTWSAWTTVGGSATEKATQTRSCTVCGRVEDTACNYVVKEHKDATCEAPEMTKYECSDCKHGYTVIGEGAKGHNFTKESGVKNNGNGTHSFACANGCGEYGFGTTKNMSVACDDWKYANTEAGKHTATCKTCGYVKIEDCSGGEATCTAKAVCQFCNTAYGELEDHNYDGNTYFEGVEKAKDATCTAQAEYYTYCSACKKSSKGTDEEATFAYGDLLPHTYTGNTEFLYKATEAKCEVNETYYVYCSECKASSEGTAEEATFEKADTALKHVWVNAQHNADTLTHTFTCERDCGETMTANCADSAVSYGYEPATCTEQGYDIVQCAACGHQWNINYTAALGHDYTQKVYDEAHLKSAANCEQANVYYYDCSRCDKNAKDETDTEKYTTLTYLNGEVRQHDFHNKVDAKYLADKATCFAAAKYFTSCKYEDCGKSSEEVYGEGNGTKFSSGKALDHDWTEVEDAKYLATKADCANDATYYYECSLCKNSSKDYGDGATWTDVDSKSGHSMTHTAAKAADCYEAGNLEYWYCDTCKKYYKDAEGKEAYLGQSETVIKKREHDLATFSYKAATCEEDGHPAYVDCKYEDCDYTTLPAELPNGYKATGHNFTGAYTYDAVNLYHSKLCANGCGASGMVVDGAQVKFEVTFNGEDEAVIVGGVKCEFTYTESTKNGVHTHANSCVCGNNNTKVYSDEETFVETVAPTCTTKGYDSYACKDCGATWTKNEVKANGHTPADKPTTNGDGTHSIYCTVEGCGYKISTDKCSGGEATCSEQAICEKCFGAYGTTGDHVFATEEWKYNDDAKCDVNGTETNHCTVCDEDITREAKGTALEHIMSDYVYELPEGVTIKDFDASLLKEPTCGEEGYAVSYCTLCNDKYKTKRVPKIADAHVWETDENGELVWTPAGGNCATGVTMINTCTVCGETQSNVVSGVHTWVVNARVEANCEVDGYIVFKCSACSFTLLFDKNYEGYPVFEGVDYELTEKLGHTWEREGSTDTLIVDKESTCAIAGRGHYVCGDCQDESDSIEIEKKEHTLIEIEEQKATCTIDGYKAYVKCVACAYDEHLDEEWLAVEGNYTKATGHKDDDSNGKCDGCKKEMVGDDTDKCDCICHKDSWFSRLIYKILRFFWKLFKIGKTCCGTTVHY